MRHITTLTVRQLAESIYRTANEETKGRTLTAREVESVAFVGDALRSLAKEREYDPEALSTTQAAEVTDAYVTTPAV